MRKTLFTLAALAALAVPSAASAADYTGTVGPSSPTFAWDGGPGTSLGVNTGVIGGASVGNFIGCFDDIADCEEALIKVEAPGKLTLTTDSADDENDTIDMYLWPSDANGEYDDSGDDIAEGTGAGTTGDEKIEAQVNPGFYVVQIKFFLADADTYKGTATLSGFPVPVAATPTTTSETPTAAPAPQQTAPAPQQQSQPAAQDDAKKKAAAKKKLAKKKKACQKKAKKIKNKSKRKKALKKCAKIKK